MQQLVQSLFRYCCPYGLAAIKAKFRNLRMARCCKRRSVLRSVKEPLTAHHTLRCRLRLHFLRAYLLRLYCRTIALNLGHTVLRWCLFRHITRLQGSSVLQVWHFVANQLPRRFFDFSNCGAFIKSLACRIVGNSLCNLVAGSLTGRNCADIRFSKCSLANCVYLAKRSISFDSQFRRRIHLLL